MALGKDGHFHLSGLQPTPSPTTRGALLLLKSPCSATLDKQTSVTMGPTLSDRTVLLTSISAGRPRRRLPFSFQFQSDVWLARRNTTARGHNIPFLCAFYGFFMFGVVHSSTLQFSVVYNSIGSTTVRATLVLKLNQKKTH